MMSATRRAMTDAMLRRMNTSCDSEAVPPAEVVSIVEEMQGHPGDELERAKVFSSKYPSFLEQCPVLFERACRRGFDVGMLRYMADAAERDSGESDVGEALARRYVWKKNKPAVS